MESLIKYWNENSKISLLGPDFDPEEESEQDPKADFENNTPPTTDKIPLENENVVSEFEIPADTSSQK